jgi:hypothetical protein
MLLKALFVYLLVKSYDYQPLTTVKAYKTNPNQTFATYTNQTQITDQEFHYNTHKSNTTASQ